MKVFFLLVTLSFTFCKYSRGQILCILCYDQNDSISDGVNNLLLDGGFENGCLPNGYFCPASSGYQCDITNWTCTGGGIDTYAQIYDGSISQIPEGNKAAYFGNFFCNACSNTAFDTSCLITLDCTVTGIPNGYPENYAIYGGTTGVSLEQEVTGLTVGDTYVLEFWAGGEDFDSFHNKGLFAVDVGFGDTLLRCKPTGPGKIGTTYVIEFNAIASSQTIKFTNWGHICSDCTELVLDNVRLYTIAELAPSIPVCPSPFYASFVASDNLVCQKFCVDFTDLTTGNPISWQWSFPGAAPSSSTNQNPTNICYDVPGTYDVTLITTNANGSDTLTLHNYITVYPTPAIPTITQNDYTLTSSTADFYQWQLDATDIPGATNQSYDVLQTGFYTVVVSDSNSCKNSTTLYVEITGIDEVNDGSVSIYPNPSSGNLFVEFMNEEFSGEVSIDVVNSLGQKIYSSSEIISSSNTKKEITLTSFTPGVYYFEVKSSGYLLRRKIILSK